MEDRLVHIFTLGGSNELPLLHKGANFWKDYNINKL